MKGKLMLKCPFCHFENEDGALFCEQCKSDLGLAEPAVASEIGPGTGGLSPLEGHALSAAPDPITPLAADVVSEPHVVETIPMAELAPARDLSRQPVFQVLEEGFYRSALFFLRVIKGFRSGVIHHGWSRLADQALVPGED